METGFSFGGKTYDEKIENMLNSFNLAIDIYTNDKPQWKRIKSNAKKVRFTWEKSITQYYAKLYLV